MQSLSSSQLSASPPLPAAHTTVVDNDDGERAQLLQSVSDICEVEFTTVEETDSGLHIRLRVQELRLLWHYGSHANTVSTVCMDLLEFL